MSDKKVEWYSDHHDNLTDDVRMVVITTTHHKGCDMCEAYALHIIEASKVPTVEILPREVENAFQIAWPNIVRHIEDKASSELDKKVEWYSDCHDNLTDDVRMAENKASTEQDHC